MNRTLAFADREIFWPPADELIEAAERIRARLGEWPRAQTPWRICLTPPDSPGAGDLIVVTADESDVAPGQAAWLAAGAGVRHLTAARLYAPTTRHGGHPPGGEYLLGVGGTLPELPAAV